MMLPVEGGSIAVHATPRGRIVIEVGDGDVEFSVSLSVEQSALVRNGIEQAEEDAIRTMRGAA